MPGRTILVIDDEGMWHKLLKRFLGDAGYCVYAAATCADGIRLAEFHKPDCIVLDFHLADGDALSVCAGLREIEDVSEIPVIIFSSDPAVEIEAYSQCRAKSFVLKGCPESLLELRKSIGEVLPPALPPGRG